MPGPVVMIKWGVIAAAGDITMAAIIRRTSSESRAAIIELIESVAAAIIADDPTIVAAAQAAVTAQLGPMLDAQFIERDVIVGSDYRALLMKQIPNTARVGLDLNGVPDELDLDENGRLKVWAAQAIVARGGGGGGGGGTTGTDILGGFGQSNMALSLARPTPAGCYDEDPNIQVWDGSALTTMPATYSSPLAGIAREWRKANPSRRVVIVNGAEGSTAFSSSSIDPPPAGYSYAPNGTWDRTLTADPNNLALRLNTRMKALKTAQPSARVAALFYSGSEGDTERLNRAQLSAKLDDLINWYRSEWATPELPVVVSSMVPEYERDRGLTYTQDVSDALADTPTRLLYTSYFRGPWNAQHAQDYIHFSPAAIPLRGKALFAGVERARSNRPGWRPLEPQNLRAERTGSAVIFTWDHPNGPLAGGFEADTSTDGDTWTPVALRAPGQMHVEVTSAARIRIRVRTLDDAGTDHSYYVTVEG